MKTDFSKNRIIFLLLGCGLFINCTTLTGQNTPPVANNDAYSVVSSGTLEVNAPGVLSNDTDADEDDLTAVEEYGPTNSSSSLDLNSDGSFTYTHDGSVIVRDTFAYRANDGTENSADSALVVITIYPELYGGTIASNQTICYNADVAAFTSAADASGGSGSYTYTWQYSITSSTAGEGTWYNIPLSNSTTYDYGILTDTTYFVRKAEDNTYPETAYSNVITVNVWPQLVGGTIAGTQTICYNDDVAPFTSTDPATGGSGNITYTWQYSTTSTTPGSGGWTNISSSDFLEYDYGTLTETTNFVRRAIDASCGTVYSNVITVNVWPELLGGAITGNQTICYNDDVTSFTSTDPASGGSGSITYTWQYSTTSSVAGSGTWTDIIPSNTLNYDYGTLTETTYFARRAVDGSCGTVYSNVITVTVRPELLGGNIISDQTICYNDDVAPFTSTDPASGGSGSITYTWQYSTTSSTAGEVGEWTDIIPSNTLNYDYGTLTDTTYFVRRAVDAICGTAYSNVITVNVHPELVGGNIAGNQTICYNADVAAFTSAADASGGSGSYTYTWQYSTTSSVAGSGTWIDIPLSDNPAYDYGTLTDTTYFVRRAVDASCGTVYSNVITVNVRPELVGGTITGNQTICYNEDVAPFTSTAPASGGSESITYTWQYSTTSSVAGSGTWTDIIPSNTLNYDYGTITDTTYFVRRAEDAICGAVYSNVITVIVHPELLGGTIEDDQTICYNADVAAFTSAADASGGSGSYTYTWQYSTTSLTPGDGSWTDISSSDSPIHDYGTLTETTFFVRRAVDACGTVYSNVITVTVYDPLDGGTIAGNQTICYNEDVAPFTSTDPASGGSGSITYTWQYSTTSSTAGEGSWTDIPSSDSETYDYGILSETTYFVRKAEDACGTVYSDVITVNVIIPTASISGSYVICEYTNATVPVYFSGDAPWSFQYRLVGGDTIAISNVQSSPRYLSLKDEGTYELIEVLDDNNCSGIVTGYVTVDTISAPEVTLSGLDPAYAEETLRTPIYGDPEGGTHYCLSEPQAIIKDGDTWYFYPVIAQIGIHTLVYSYMNPSTYCYGYDTVIVSVLEDIASINFPDDRTFYCENDGPFTITGVNIVNDIGSFTIEGGVGLTDNLNNTATIDPSLLNIDSYTITYSSIEGGEIEFNKTATLYIGYKPEANFTWESECFQAGQAINMNDDSDPVNGSVTSYLWLFYDGPYCDSLKTQNVSYTFPESGTYDVELQIETSYGCIDTITKVFNLRPVIKLAGQTYFEDFEDSPVSWESGTSENVTVNSWQLGSPSKGFSGASSGDHCWYTYIASGKAPREQSWITSPCFDFTDTQRPMVKLDIWRLFNATRDGAVLQATADSGKTWQNIGILDDGINWFNSFLISGLPGGQQIGWSNIRDLGWIEARHSVDVLKNKTEVQFRIAYGSDNTALNTDGIAFDDFWIGERDKVALIEHFTNSSDQKSKDANQALNELVSSNSLNVIDLQYHTAFPGEDPFNENNPYITNARLLQYGLSSVPYSILDGGAEAQHRFDYEDNDLEEKIVLIQSLIDSKFWINISANLSGNLVEVEAEIIANQYIPLSELIVHIAIIEHKIDEETGNNGETEFYSVVNSLLPDAGGTTLNKSWEENEYYKLDHSSNIQNVYDPEELRVVVFIQEFETHEVYQAALDTVHIITGIENPSSSDIDQSSFNIYPNPASTHAFIKLIKPLENDAHLELLNAVGTVIYSATLSEGQTKFDFSIEDYPDGFYIVRLASNQESLGTSKFTIQH